MAFRKGKRVRVQDVYEVFWGPDEPVFFPLKRLRDEAVGTLEGLRAPYGVTLDPEPQRLHDNDDILQVQPTGRIAGATSGGDDGAPPGASTSSSSTARASTSPAAGASTAGVVGANACCLHFLPFGFPIPPHTLLALVSKQWILSAKERRFARPIL